MEEKEIVAEAANYVMWGDFPLCKVLESMQERSPEGLLILLNMILTCTYYISIINSNKATFERVQWVYQSY